MGLQVQSPFQQFFDLDGGPLDNGSIYIGNSGQNPQQYPIPIFWDQAGTIPALQPVKTLNGYAVRNGTPARIYVENVDYSITVKDSRGRVVFTALSVTAVTFNALAAPTGSSLIGFQQVGAHTVARTVLDRGRDAVSIKDYANNGTDAAQAITDMATDYGFVRIPFGGFPVATSVTVSVPIWFDEGAYLIASGGVTVTINNAIQSPRQYIFQGSGSYVLGHSTVTDNGEQARQVHVSWFGAFPNPDPGPDQAPFIQKACTAMGNGRESEILFDMGNYNVDSGITTTRGCHIKGTGQRRTVFKTATDGFSVFTTSETACRFSGIQFELHLSTISNRTSPFITINHDMCDVYDINMGSTEKGLVINGLRCRVSNVLGAYNANKAAGSSLIQVLGGDCTIQDVFCMTSSTVGPESVILVGGAAVATISGIYIRNVDSVLPSKLVKLDATLGTVRNVIMRDIRYTGFAGTPPDSAVHMITGSTFELKGVIMDGAYFTGFAVNNIKLEQNSSDEMSEISFENIYSAGANGGFGIGFLRTAGSMTGITVGSSVNVKAAPTPFSFSGGPTVLFDPIAITDAVPGISYDIINLADDAFVQINLNRSVFAGIAMLASGVANYGIFSIRAAVTPAVGVITASANVAAVNIPLNGTTGVDGRITVGITNGVIYVENRSGVTQRMSLSLLTGNP